MNVRLQNMGKLQDNMGCYADSLYNTTMKYIAKHLDLVESFVNFPSLVAEDIFKAFCHEYNGEKDVPILNVLTKYLEAYENLVLERLCLSGNLLTLNEHFENIVAVSRFVSELCVCDCTLGNNHELFSHISEFKRLKKLCMRNNCMTDKSMQILTLRIRVYKTGGTELEYLNLGGNRFSDSIIPWLSAFPALQYLNISGSSITVEGIQTLTDKYQLRQVLERNDHDRIETEGWAASIVEKWQQEYSKRQRVLKEAKELVSFKRHLLMKRNKAEPLPLLHPCNTSFIFRKVPVLEQGKTSFPAVRKRKTSTGCDQRKIEDDLFDQYK